MKREGGKMDKDRKDAGKKPGKEGEDEKANVGEIGERHRERQRGTGQ